MLVPRDARILRGAREPPRGTATQHAEVLAHLVRVRVRVRGRGRGRGRVRVRGRGRVRVRVRVRVRANSMPRFLAHLGGELVCVD